MIRVTADLRVRNYDGRRRHGAGSEGSHYTVVPRL